MKNEIEIKVADKVFKSEKRTFKSLKVGYGVYGKIEIDGETYQMSINIVKL